MNDVNETLQNLLIIHHVSLDELCQHLKLDPSTVNGSSDNGRFTPLLDTLEKTNRLSELYAYLEATYPNITWQTNQGGINLTADGNIRMKVGGDIVARDKITTINYGLTADEVADLVAKLKDTDKALVWDGRYPYLGLTAFQESDAQFFFGRESLVDELVERVEQATFIVIAGPSGSGKSSVARAGLFHALRSGRLERSDTWLLGTMKPKGNPLEQLAQAVSRLAKSPAAGDYIKQAGATNPLALHNQIETLLSDDPRQRCVLLVDQFEETFTQTKDEATRAAFIALLTEAAQAENGRITIILSLRADFVSHCARYPHLRTLMSQQFQLVGAMEPEDLAKAITLPALAVGAEIDPALVSRIMTDMKGEPGTLPLMSFALRDLFEAEKSVKGESMDMTLPEYIERGGIGSALKRHADQVFRDFKDKQSLVKSIFSKLIEVGQGRADTRRTVPFAELVPKGVKDETVASIVSSLAQENIRLITTSTAEGEEDLSINMNASTTVTIAHEKLIDAWPWLRQLVDDNRDMIVLQNQINDDAKLWDEEKDVDFLYRGGRLIQVEEQLKASNPDLNTLSQKFIQASLAQRTTEQNQIRNRRLASIGILVLLLVVTTIAAISFNRQSIENEHIAAENADIAAKATVAQGQAEIRRNEALTSEAIALAAGTAEANAVATALAESTRAFENQEIAEEAATRAFDSEATAQAEAATAEYNAQELATAVIQTDIQRDLALDNLSFSIVAQKDGQAIQATAIALAGNYEDLIAATDSQNADANSTSEILATVTAQAVTLSQVRMTATANASFSTATLSPKNVGSNAVILDVPYRSQWDGDAGYSLTDGGTTILAMLFNVGGVNIETDSLTGILFPDKEPNEFFTFAELIRASVTFGDDYGVPFEYMRLNDAGSATTQLYNFIDEGKPFMALVKYEPWEEITGNQYSWGSFVLVVGYDDESVYIHDPLFGFEGFQTLRDDGAYFKLPTELFFEGWGGFQSYENPNFAAIIPVNSIASQLVLDVSDESSTP